MKRFITSIKILFLALVMLYNANHGYAKDFKVLWQREFVIGKGLSCSPGAVTIDVADNNLLIMGTSFQPKTYLEGKFRLWEIDQNGNMTKDIILGDIHENITSNMISASRIISGLSVSKSRKINATGNFGGSDQTIMSLNRQGYKQMVKTIAETSLTDGDNIILKKINLPNDSSLLIGKDVRDNGLAIKIDSQGNKLWKRTYDHGQLEYFCDGVAVGNNGDFIIVGSVVEPAGKMYVGETLSIWVLRCDAEGNILSERVFSGDPFIPFVRTMPQVCQLASGKFIIAYNKLQTRGLTFKALSSNLEELWDKKAFNDDVNAFDFKIKAISSGGFILAYGIGSTGLGVCEYNNECNILNTLSWQKIVRGGNFLLEVTSDRAFIVLQARAKDKDRVNNLKVIALELSQ